MSSNESCHRCRHSRSRSLSHALVTVALTTLPMLWMAPSPSSAFTVPPRPRLGRHLNVRAFDAQGLLHPPPPSSYVTFSPPTALSALHTPTHHADLFGLPTLLTSVDTFDGSTLVDPVVVSGAFWAGLKGKILSVIIGQILAAIVFAALASAVGSQLPKLGAAVGGLFGDSRKGKAANDAASKANVSQFATTASDAVKSSSTRRGVSPDLGKLLLCLLIDAIGTSSELLPIVGEITDVAWAPVAALALRSLYGSNIVFALEFVEEILPFTDVIPLATICWVIETFAGDGDLARALGIGRYGVEGSTVIDVPSREEGRERYLSESMKDDSSRRS